MLSIFVVSELLIGFCIQLYQHFYRIYLFKIHFYLGFTILLLILTRFLFYKKKKINFFNTLIYLFLIIIILSGYFIYCSDFYYFKSVCFFCFLDVLGCHFKLVHSFFSFSVLLLLFLHIVGGIKSVIKNIFRL